MPFTLSHPAAVLPLMRRPFVPAALVAGAMAPDAPYFLAVLGVSSTSSQDWYGPFLNATETHSFGGGLVVDLPFAIGLVAAYRMLRAPITALLPSGLRLPEPERTTGLPAKVRSIMWLLLSALVGIASHLAWDSFTHGDGFPATYVQSLLHASALGGLTVDRLLQYASTAFGLAAVGWHLWRRRDRLRTHGGTDTVARLGPVMRWSVVTLLVAAPLLGGALNARDDFDAYRYETEEDYSRPITVDLGDSVSETYPSRTVQAPWGTLAEGVLTGAAKRAGASFAVALLLYSATWQIGAISRRPATASSPAPSPQPAQDGK
ncbi:DUF4184 family protein [Streptomyces hirsutus]|uniref:DUF4184 family protein n=2 Tax=Streptomyces hirsutus TaxID=35620 RepID=UPI0033F7C5BF